MKYLISVFFHLALFIYIVFSQNLSDKILITSTTDSIKLNCYCKDLALRTDSISITQLISDVNKEVDSLKMKDFLIEFAKWDFAQNKKIVFEGACNGWVHKKYSNPKELFDQIIRVNSFLSEIGYGTSPRANQRVAMIYLIVNRVDGEEIINHYEKNKDDSGIKSYWSFALDLLSQGD